MGSLEEEEGDVLHGRSGCARTRGRRVFPEKKCICKCYLYLSLSSLFSLSSLLSCLLLSCDVWIVIDRAHKDLLLQQYGERIGKLSQQDRLSKFCMDAGFLNVVEIGQYFMTKDTAGISQFHAVA